MIAAGARAEGGNAGGDRYTSYRTVGQGRLELTFDAARFADQGWSVEPGPRVMPVAADGAQALNIVSHNGAPMSMNGSPRALGSIAVSQVDGLMATIADFSMPFSGRGDVVFLGDRHPILMVSGESMQVEVNATEVTVHGVLRLHPAAIEFGLNPDVGEVGVFALVAPLEVVDVDASRPLIADAGDEGGPAAGSLPGADVTVGSLPGVWHWGASGGVRAYSVGTTSCNVGTAQLDWFADPDTRHPVIAQNMYRLMDGRFEQLGMSWVKHAFCALQGSLCDTCTPAGNCCCTRLGVGCSDPYGSNLNGSFSVLGPRSEIDAHLGTNQGSHALPSGNATLRGRIQVNQSDLAIPGALYYVEGQYIAEDDAQSAGLANDNNNASYRQVTVNGATFDVTMAGSTVREFPAIYAWQDADAAVVINTIDIPGEGRLHLGYRVTDLGGGMWHYEYALHNLSSDRSARSFSVPVGAGVTVSNIGFHDVNHHSGDGEAGAGVNYDGTDWSGTVGGGSVTWSTATFAADVNANALRWGTLYNFRFDADGPPASANVSIDLFKPGSPDTVTSPAQGPEQQGGGGGGIPTLTEWGLWIMTLTLVTAGTVIFARRRRAPAA